MDTGDGLPGLVPLGPVKNVDPLSLVVLKSLHQRGRRVGPVSFYA